VSELCSSVTDDGRPCFRMAEPSELQRDEQCVCTRAACLPAWGYGVWLIYSDPAWQANAIYRIKITKRLRHVNEIRCEKYVHMKR